MKSVNPCLLLLAWLTAAQAQNTNFTNPDFEAGDAGGAAPGWFVPPVLREKGIQAVLTESQPASGKMCLELRWPAGAAPADTFANVMQAFNATAWRGKRIRITAAIRVNSASPAQRAQMWFRVDRAGGMGAFENMGDRPVRSSAWADYSITADIADDAQQLNLGLMTFAGATAWWDSIRIERLGEFVTPKDPARPLDEPGLKNLAACARLLGYVRYYHPSDEAAAVDWLPWAIRSLPAIEAAKTASQLAQELQRAFETVAPTVRVYPGRTRPGDAEENPAPDPPRLPPELQPPRDGTEYAVRYWVHDGLGEAQPQAFAIYQSRRALFDPRPPAAWPSYAQPTNVFRAHLGAGVDCLVPTALWSGPAGTLPKATRSAPAEPAVRYTPAHRGARLVTVMLAWNIFQHFYPYFEVARTDWPAELEIALKAAATDPDEAAFYRTLNRMVVQLHDGHAQLMGPGVPVLPALDLRVEKIEGKIVVTAIPEGAQGLKPGDILDSIDGRAATEVFDEIAGEISAATPQWRDFQAALRFGPRPATPAPSLEVTHADGSRGKAKASCSGRKVPDPMRSGSKTRQLQPGIWYIDMTRITDDEFNAALPDLAKARGIVFDLRGYPMLAPKWLTHLAKSRMESAYWNVAQTRRPDRADLEWIGKARWNLERSEPQLTGNRVFLTDASAISYAESTMGIVEAYRLGPIVGEPTAGTNGNINRQQLGLGYEAVWTGMQVLKHDKSRHHGVGIEPTVRVRKTIQGVRDGRDEQLEAGLKLLKPS